MLSNILCLVCLKNTIYFAVDKLVNQGKKYFNCYKIAQIEVVPLL